MAILNYTTTVAPEKTLAEIQRRLIAFGATRFSVAYDAQRRPESVEFECATEFGPRWFRLEANTAGVFAVLRKQVGAGKLRRGFASADQANRVAWRITKDFLEASLARAEAGVVTLDEVLCAQMVGSAGRTVYQVVREQQLALEKPR